jgi:hypothetical protein
MIVEEHGFCTTLTLVIAGTETNGVDITPVGLGLRVYVRIAIDLTGRRLKDLTLRSAGETQHVIGSKHRGLGSLDRVCLIIDRRSRTSQIVDLIYLSPIWLAHIMTYNLKIGFTQQMPHVLFTACVEVVETDHVITIFY